MQVEQLAEPSLLDLGVSQEVQEAVPGEAAIFPAEHGSQFIEPVAPVYLPTAHEIQVNEPLLGW